MRTLESLLREQVDLGMPALVGAAQLLAAAQPDMPRDEEHWGPFCAGVEFGLLLALRHPEWAWAAVAQCPPDRTEVGATRAEVDGLLDAAVKCAPILRRDGAAS